MIEPIFAPAWWNYLKSPDQSKRKMPLSDTCTFARAEAAFARHNLAAGANAFP